MQIELDVVRNMIVSGLADPQSESPLVASQYETSAEACCSLARTFIGDGYDVAIDDAETPGGFEVHWNPHLRGIDWSIVVIRPGVETSLRRNAARQKTVREDVIRRQHEASGEWPTERIVDTTDLSIEASLDRVKQMLRTQEI